MTATPEELYASVAEEFLGDPGATQPADAAGSKARFGASTLKVDNRIFAMLAPAGSS